MIRCECVHRLILCGRIHHVVNFRDLLDAKAIQDLATATVTQVRR